MTPEQVAGLTLGQLACELGRSDRGRNLSPAEVAERHAKRQDDCFRRVCERFAVKPARLPGVGGKRLARYVELVTGQRPPDANALVALAASFAERQHGERYRPTPPR